MQPRKQILTLTLLLVPTLAAPEGPEELFLDLTLYDGQYCHGSAVGFTQAKPGECLTAPSSFQVASFWPGGSLWTEGTPDYFAYGEIDAFKNEDCTDPTYRINFRQCWASAAGEKSWKLRKTAPYVWAKDGQIIEARPAEVDEAALNEVVGPPIGCRSPDWFRYTDEDGKERQIALGGSEDVFAKVMELRTSSDFGALAEYPEI